MVAQERGRLWPWFGMPVVVRFAKAVTLKVAHRARLLRLQQIHRKARYTVVNVGGRASRRHEAEQKRVRMSPLKKLQSSLSLTEQAHQSIKRYILVKNPGADVRLTETFFAEQLGISKSPVREALNSLQSEGLLRIEPRRGAYIHRFSGKEIADLYELREAIETFAAATVPITPELVLELRRSVERTGRLLRSGKKAAYIDEDIFFHRMIVGAAGNHELSRVHSNLQDKLWLCRCQTYQLTSSDTPSAHRKITEAIASGDRVGAQQMTSSHIQFVRTALVQAWERANAGDELSDPSAVLALQPAL